MYCFTPSRYVDLCSFFHGKLNALLTLCKKKSNLKMFLKNWYFLKVAIKKDFSSVL